ncbi:MAG: SRPBCC family protein [Jatrophihabitans sp.]
MPDAPLQMTEVRQLVAASADRVFAELADGWAYVGWVVGATHIRDVDHHWPATGSKIHHQVGGWPTVVSDYTESIECEPGRRLLLRARGWPFGEAVVEIVLVEQDDRHTEVLLREAPSAGPGRLLDNPALRWLLHRRNAETLSRLKDRVEHRRLVPDA